MASRGRGPAHPGAVMANPFEVRELARGEWASFQDRIAGLERGINYPLGTDRFEIDHGDDYFAFFERLGSPRVFVALHGEQLAAVAVFVLRRVAPKAGTAAREVWYACDLKVAPSGRGRGILGDLMRRAYDDLHSLSPRVYGISMDPGDGGRNRIVRVLRRMSPLTLRVAARLAFVTLDRARSEEVREVLSRHRGQLSHVSLIGRKDIVLASTGRPIPLLHLQFGEHAEAGYSSPQADHVHMFCYPRGDPLGIELESRGFTNLPTATVIEFGMEDQDWSFVLTSDI